VKFTATVQLNGRTATGIQVPAEVVEGLGPSRRPAVRVTINGHAYRSTVAPMRGEFLLPVSAEVRERASVAAGDRVEVHIELDTEPREVTVPADLADAIAGDAVATRAFEALSYSARQRVVLPVEAARTADTRARRVAKAVTDLNGGA
jgi:hypothetical protein